uniref:ANF_receptor domain-containing protein n=1 Tax=Panagrellus redivivus TaxID=6233 RepID=A0A7E4W554_PANRE
MKICSTSKLIMVMRKVVLDNKCICHFNQSSYNMCYQMQVAPFTTGYPFSCKFVSHLANLGLLDESNSVSPMTHTPVLVTAFSSTYYYRGLNMISAYRKIFPRDRIAVYDLGLEGWQLRRLRKICNVVVILFPFNLYPDYFNVLNHYRWKPVVITMALKSYGSIIYADTSVQFRNANYLRVPGIMNCNFTFKNRFQCSRSQYMLHSYAGHNIQQATMSSVLKYLPSDVSRLKDTDMYEAGLVSVIKTPETIELLKWLVLCALEEFCIAPRVNRPVHRCSFNDDVSLEPTCHRFDQSVINVLLANANNFSTSNYTSGLTDFYGIRRGDDSDPDEITLVPC